MDSNTIVALFWKHFINMKLKGQNIKSIHEVDGKKILVLECVEPSFKPKKKKLKAKKYFNKIKNSK